jgi:hypothetical protein
MGCCMLHTQELHGRNSCPLLKGSWELPFAVWPTVGEQKACEMLLHYMRWASNTSGGGYM